MKLIRKVLWLALWPFQVAFTVVGWFANLMLLILMVSNPFTLIWLWSDDKLRDRLFVGAGLKKSRR